MKPDQIISLMTFDGADNTLAMADHADHIHVGWKPLYGTNSKAAKQVNAVLKPSQWIKLIDRLKEIDNPEVSLQPSKYSVKVTSAARPTRTTASKPRRGARRPARHQLASGEWSSAASCAMTSWPATSRCQSGCGGGHKSKRAAATGSGSV